MDESKKKKEYLKKLEKRKLKKSQEYKALAFSTGITLVFALLFGFFGYSFITGEVRVIPLIIAAAFLAEGLAQGLILRKMRAQILCQRPVSTAIRLSGLLLIIFICTGNIFAAAAGFTLIKKSRTLEYTMTIYALITTVFVMMVSALNLFKDYVSNSFMLGMGLLTAMIVFYLLTFFSFTYGSGTGRWIRSCCL